MTKAFGPVTAAKSIYEDDKGYLIMATLPFVDQQSEGFMEEQSYSWYCEDSWH
jgi:hypothetical protein